MIMVTNVDGDVVENGKNEDGCDDEVDEDCDCDGGCDVEGEDCAVL